MEALAVQDSGEGSSLGGPGEGKRRRQDKRGGRRGSPRHRCGGGLRRLPHRAQLARGRYCGEGKGLELALGVLRVLSVLGVNIGVEVDRLRVHPPKQVGPGVGQKHLHELGTGRQDRRSGRGGKKTAFHGIGPSGVLDLDLEGVYVIGAPL